jgi:hypothetical protein
MNGRGKAEKPRDRLKRDNPVGLLSGVQTSLHFTELVNKQTPMCLQR